MAKGYVTAKELSDAWDISLGKAYEIIRELNKQLTKQGYIVVAGKCPRKYFSEKFYGYEAPKDEVPQGAVM
jgi:sugar-specific transcriptional regulator TrmB